MTCSLSIFHAFLINHKINLSKKIFHNFKIRESKTETIFLKASSKHPKTPNKSNTHINKKKESFKVKRL
jgi:hypothetical protein